MQQPTHAKSIFKEKPQTKDDCQVFSRAHTRVRPSFIFDVVFVFVCTSLVRLRCPVLLWTEACSYKSHTTSTVQERQRNTQGGTFSPTEGNACGNWHGRHKGILTREDAPRQGAAPAFSLARHTPSLSVEPSQETPATFSHRLRLKTAGKKLSLSHSCLCSTRPVLFQQKGRILLK